MGALVRKFCSAWGRDGLSAVERLDGMTFKRIDPVPYSFQPVSIKGPAKAANYGAATDLTFDVRNYDNYDHCYWISYQVPDGWRWRD
jgi:hypothetical protein